MAFELMEYGRSFDWVFRAWELYLRSHLGFAIRVWNVSAGESFALFETCRRIFEVYRFFGVAPGFL